jgi:hypothetical protein
MEEIAGNRQDDPPALNKHVPVEGEIEINRDNSTDTIPESLKPYFFTDKSMPNLENYDAIGFDVDHCFVKYNVTQLAKHLIQNFLDDLQDNFEGYPAETTDFDFDNDLNVFMNNAVWDIEHGIVLKLAEDKVITHAICGFENLSHTQIISIYGDPPVFKHLKWPQSSRLLDQVEGAHWVLNGFFDACKVPVIC